MTGYDVKKIIADSETLPWTANNNQIYRALVDLHKADWVSKTVEQQDGAPNRHIYAITEAGTAALKEWVMTAPELPQIKHTFITQLMWADTLTTAELDELFDSYITTIGEKLFFLRVQADQKPNMPQRTDREAYLWHMIGRNLIAQHELELQWARQAREELVSMTAVH